MSVEKIDKIKKVAKAIQPGADEVSKVVPNKDQFDSLMVQGKQKEATTAQQSEAIASNKQNPSLMDQVRDVNRRVDMIKRANPNDLVAQAQDVIGKIEEIKQKLATPNLEIKQSVQNLLKNKLSHIDDSLKIALSKAGVEYKIPEKNNVSSNPIERFLGYLTNGQYQLQHLSDEVESMGVSNTMSPASMLAVQIKVSYIQQELEFFTNLLNKALESTKTIMNVQV